MDRALTRLGRACAEHPWRTVGAWVVAAVVVVGLVLTAGGTTRDDYEVGGIEAEQGLVLLEQHLPDLGGAGARVVVHDRDGAPLDAATLASLTERLGAMPHVSMVLPPRRSDGRTTAIVRVRYDVPVTDPALFANTDPLERAVAPTGAAGLQVELGGELPESTVAAVEGRGEVVGLSAALVILLLTFGSVLAAGVPLLTAVVGLGVGLGGVYLLASVLTISTSAPTVASMVGLGVGLDYALLLLTRHREQLAAGDGVVDATGRTLATAGRSVVFAGVTVLVSLIGLRVADIPSYNSFGYATACTVVAVVLASLTLVPALLGLLGERLRPRGRGTRRRAREPWAAGWARRVARHPGWWAGGAALLMVVLAVPTLQLRTWPQDASMQTPDLTTRRASDLVTEAFGPGANAALTVVAPTSRAGDGGRGRVEEVLAAPGQGSTLGPPVTSPDGAITVWTHEPPLGPTDPGFPAYVERLRADLPADVEVTGRAALLADFAGLLESRLPRVVVFVVSVSLLFLLLIFRSVAVPLKAALMNLLSIGAAYGVVVAVFQWGWGLGALGLDHTVPISSFLPILMFAVLFGLSMDYEVFLLSRVRESWLATGDPRGSVVDGLAATGRVISAAAAIMVAVFLGFASETDVIVKQISIGMAVAVALDATVVRMVLVPATMTLLGRWNWWLPPWLERRLPRVDVEPASTLAPTA